MTRQGAAYSGVGYGICASMPELHPRVPVEHKDRIIQEACTCSCHDVSSTSHATANEPVGPETL